MEAYGCWDHVLSVQTDGLVLFDGEGQVDKTYWLLVYPTLHTSITNIIYSNCLFLQYILYSSSAQTP